MVGAGSVVDGCSFKKKAGSLEFTGAGGIKAVLPHAHMP
jgi:hypothetical protein